MSFQIEVNGVAFGLWENASVSRSIDNNTGSFNFTNSSLLPAEYPVRAGDYVRVLVNNIPIVTGFVDEVHGSGSAQEHSITVSGRDNTADLIDSSLPDASKSLEGPITLNKMASNIVSELGATIQIIDNTGLQNIINDEKIDGTDGETCMGHLVSYARKLQVYLIADGLGKLEIFRPGGSRSSSPLVHVKNGTTNNVIKWKFREGHQSRYSKYICRSQDDVGFSLTADYGVGGTSRTGFIEDDSIRSGRLLEIKAEETLDDAKCKARANEEANLRRARSTEYTAVLAGTQQADDENWRLGDIVEVLDDFAALSGDFLIRSISYKISNTEGSTTEITIAPVDAYTVQGVETAINKRKSKRGTQLVNDKPNI